MDYQATQHWLSGILPVAPEFRQAGDFRIGPVVAGTQSIAVTGDFARTSSGLQTPGPDGATAYDVRTELMVVAEEEPNVVVRVLRAAAELLAGSRGLFHARPGTLLPDLYRRAELNDSDGLEAITVRHGLLVPPFMWGAQTPRLTEAPDEVTGENITEGAGRFTLVLQILMITDEERAQGEKEGFEAVTAALADAHTNVLDWRR